MRSGRGSNGPHLIIGSSSALPEVAGCGDAPSEDTPLERCVPPSYYPAQRAARAGEVRVTKYEWLLFLHLVGAFLIATGSGLGTGLYVAMRRTRSVRTLEALLRVGGIVPMITIPGALLAIIFGTWLVQDVQGFDFEQFWIWSAYVMWIAAMGLSAAVLGPGEKRAHALAEQEIAAGRDESPALQAMIEAPLFLGVTVALNVLIVLFLATMTFKPGL